MWARTLLSRGVFNKTFVENWHWLALVLSSYHLKICLSLPYICKVFTWNGRYLHRFHCRFSSNLKWHSLKPVSIACCSFFDIIARIEFLKTLSLHVKPLMCTLTLQSCETLALKIEFTDQLGDHLWKWSCSSGNGFWLAYEDLSIDFGTKILLRTRDLACKTGCQLSMSSQLFANWLVTRKQN